MPLLSNTVSPPQKNPVRYFFMYGTPGADDLGTYGRELFPLVRAAVRERDRIAEAIPV